MEGKVDHTGIMIHEVIKEVDMGSPIVTEEIAFVKGEDEDIEKFKDKVHTKEHRLIVEGTRRMVAKIRGEPTPNTSA